MMSWLLRKVRFWQLQEKDNEKGESGEGPTKSSSFTGDLDRDLGQLRKILNESGDIVVRRFTVGKKLAALIFLDGMVDKTVVNEDVLRPLMVEKDDVVKPSLDYIESKTLYLSESKRTSSLEETAASVATGFTGLLLSGSQEVLLLSTKGWEKRAIAPPQTEAAVRGPHEGFIESLQTNVTLLRRRVANPSLTFDKLTIGERTKTAVYVTYIKGLANPKLVEEVKRRLRRIKTDSILESGYLEEFIEDAPFSPFATVGNSERPDKVAAKMLEGRVAVMVDGTPMVLTMPLLFVESFQSVEDYYARPWYTILLRWVRFLSLGITVLAPAIYVALTTFHQELLPTPLLLTMAAAREGTPFPAVVEALVMGLAFEILREAGVRLPRPVGQAVSIVGALVIGDATVSAGLVGAPMVIVVAITAISSFVITPLVDAATLLRIAFVIFASMFGVFGIVMGLLAVLVHLATLRSFGAPFLSPIAPTSLGGMKDVFIRAPWWDMFARPRVIGWRDPQRQKFRLMPHPPDDDSEEERPEKKGRAK